MNFERLYDYRQRGVDQNLRNKVWFEISQHLYRLLGSPKIILDPAAGHGEFIRAVPAQEKWAVDQTDFGASAHGVHFIRANTREVELPDDYFDAIFVSNFLEHLNNQDEVAEFLTKMRQALKTGGKIAILGPNFKYASASYFDCADHTIPLTHISVAEHLYATGFEVGRIIPQYLPFSFRGRLPASQLATRIYLKVPLLWSLFGRQFLVCGYK